ncbi:MAG: hypothetical protein WCF33_03705 [Pseudonocardiaceae bacterium]
MPHIADQQHVLGLPSALRQHESHLKGGARISEHPDIALGHAAPLDQHLLQIGQGATHRGDIG